MIEAIGQLLREVPSFVDGLIGGIVAYATIYLVHRTWKITRRPKDDKEEL